ncbi:hypothetical protein [Paracraurococcus ruber]|uniref:hypothetical protein n=1 Tax=Paracraurococcus ruber TaxID=77675 RepID=UPI001057F8C1|nr:hypothetical protein [Paracraurococcus ruber]TDG27196.1 hypothetical protein E2C05_23700 [Paracraurococcus ruber]
MDDIQTTPPAASGGAIRRGEAMRNATSRGHQRVARIRRCLAAGQPSEDEIRRMVQTYLAQGGEVHVCAPAYVLPVQNAGAAAIDVRS